MAVPISNGDQRKTDADDRKPSISTARDQKEPVGQGVDDTSGREPQDVQLARTERPPSEHPSSSSGSHSRKDTKRPSEPARQDQGINWNIYRYTLYETATCYYIVGGDTTDERFKVLRVDRTAENGKLQVREDDRVYNRDEVKAVLEKIDEASKSMGNLKTKFNFWGILGFIRFTGPYYMLLIKKRSQVAVLGGHYIYRIDQTELISLTAPGYAKTRQTTTSEETRFLGILTSLDLSRSFYFSHAYNLSRTLQENILADRQRASADGLVKGSVTSDFNSMFVWNEHLLKPALKSLPHTYSWCIPIVHGFIDQASLSVYGRTIYITVLARRSRHFAGARFLKRGANDLGYVANDVETEQIVSDMLTSSFHGPTGQPFASPNYTSYVQHRGSIPLFWSQENSGVSPKPPIELNLVDPFYSAAALHFDDLFERYGTPLIVLNLVKARERTPRESKLLAEYSDAIAYLNQFLPSDKKIIYKPWDMSRAAHSPDQDVIQTLESIGESVVQSTGIFQNGSDEDGLPKLQNGVCRTNCIDCLDRTNAAQFVVGKRALGHQLHILGILKDKSIDYDSDTVNLFTHMFHDHGDTLAVQYGGSQLVNTMETYRRINQWSSHSRDMVESFKRYYNNSFLDNQRQEAYNLFLGNYIFMQGQPMLWDLSTDYYLHHADPRAYDGKKRRSYIKWYTKENLKPRKVEESAVQSSSLRTALSHSPDIGYWIEYYRPSNLSSFRKMFAYTMNSSLRYLPNKSSKDPNFDFSPFRVRHPGQSHEPELISNQKLDKSRRKDPQTDGESDISSLPDQHQKYLEYWNEKAATPVVPQQTPGKSSKASKGHRHIEFAEPDYQAPKHHKPANLPLGDGPPATSAPSAPTSGSGAPWTIDNAFSASLNPQVTMQEMVEYERYIAHPSTLPPIVSTESANLASTDVLDFLEFCNFETAVQSDELIEPDVATYEDFVVPVEDPLAIREGDLGKKRYRAYEQWIKGRSMLRQPRLETAY